MAARYYVYVAQELLDSGPPWEDAGLHLIEQGALTRPGVRVCRFLDDNAPEELEGKTVELALTREAADDDTFRTYVSDRQVVC